MNTSPVCKQSISITGVILAGGLARRMGGKNKAFLKILDKALIQYILKNLEVSLDEILINANQNHKKFESLGFPVISDHIDGFAGPLAGMAAGLQTAKTSHILVVPCDSPFITDDLVSRFVTAHTQTNADICVAHDGQRLQPVFALINIKVLPSLLAYLESGNHKIDTWYEQQNMTTVDFSDAPQTFININTPEELRKSETQMMLNTIKTPVLGFAAHSGSGKTTLLTKLIPALKAKSLSIGLVKHAHHGFEIDYPGKDSYELRKAGATQVIVGSQLRWAHIVETPEAEEKPSLANLISQFEHDTLDLILVEGFKLENIPKIEVFRPTLGKERLSIEQDDYIAIATDEPLKEINSSRQDITALDLNNIDEIVSFVLAQLDTK